MYVFIPSFSSCGSGIIEDLQRHDIQSLVSVSNVIFVKIKYAVHINNYCMTVSCVKTIK